MQRARAIAAAAAAVLCTAAPSVAPAETATLEPLPAVRGAEIETVRVRAAGAPWRTIAWENLDRIAFEPGAYEVQFPATGPADGGGSLALPHCVGRDRVAIDGRAVTAADGPVVVALAPGLHDIRIALRVSGSGGRIIRETCVTDCFRVGLRVKARRLPPSRAVPQ